MSAQWPSKEEVVARILEVAEEYALDVAPDHPEDIAYALVTAIDVAWRTIEPLRVES